MKIVIIGAGFGGLRLARLLNNKPGFDITLVDKFNFHQFQPLFYQVATSGLDASNISFPLRKVFHNSRNVRFRMAIVTRIDQMQKMVITETGNFSYDTLIIATGAGTNFFGNAETEKYAFPMKSTFEALQVRYRLLQNFEDAVSEKDPLILQRLLNVVIVGGGATGVELSGAIADLKNDVLPRDYPELDFTKMNIFLLEGTGRLLGSMSDESSRESLKYLEGLGVNVLTNTILHSYDGKTASLQNGNKIETALVIWAAGIKGNIPGGIGNDMIAKGNRIRTDRRCRVIGQEHVYAIGDVAYLEGDSAWPNGHPQVAPVAIQQAEMLAKYFRKGCSETSVALFAYKNKGAMATVGRNLAVVDVPRPKLHFKGFIAWFIWMSLHLMLILGVKNRFFVFSNWVYNYFTRDQNLRLIFKEFYRETGKK